MRPLRVLVAVAIVASGFSVKAWQAPGGNPWFTTPAALALTTSPNSIAYDLSTTALILDQQPQLYLSVFHSEAYVPTDASNTCTGDSTSAKYSSTPLVNAHHNKNQDHLITRGMDSDGWYQSYQALIPPCLGLSGAGNAILTFNQHHYWAFNYLTVANRGAGFKHHLMTALVDYSAPGADILNVFNSPLYYLNHDQTSCPFGPPFCEPGLTMTHMFPQGNGLGAMAGRTFPVTNAPAPAHELGSYSTISSAVGYEDGETWGLMGNMTYSSDYQKLYFYYTDIEFDLDPDQAPPAPGNPPRTGRFNMKLLRREATKTGPGGPGSGQFYYMTEFTPREVLMGPPGYSPPDQTTDLGSSATTEGSLAQLVGNTLITNSAYMKVAFHQHLGKWVLLYLCNTDDGKNDICMQLSTNPNLSDLTSVKSNDSAAFGLKIYNDAPASGMGNAYVLGQFGIRKSGWGMHFSDGYGDVIVYFPIRPSSDPNPYGKQVYVKRVCINGPCP